MKMSIGMGTVNKSGVDKFFNGGDRVCASHIYILSGEIISLFKTIKMEIEFLLQRKSWDKSVICEIHIYFFLWK